MQLLAWFVALRKESVDRNKQIIDLKAIDKPSLSARRAWIEIPGVLGWSPAGLTVALRKESVDRNADGVVSGAADYVVALRKESVDRNLQSLGLVFYRHCRSPQGERG